MTSKNLIALMFGWLGFASGSTDAVGAEDVGQPSAMGVVSGVVSNQATGDLLPGARLAIEGTSVMGVAERGGAFSLSLPAGNYTLVASFPGLDNARVPVSVSAGQTITRAVELNSPIYKMESFSVSGVREGSALAIQAQREAPNAKIVAAIDTFGNPAANPGELLQRLPGITTSIDGAEVRGLTIRGMGPAFSTLMVDGNAVATSTGSSASRDYQIEQFGTGNIESVELIKAPLPDQDANAVAGYVNLITRRSFDLPGRRIAVTAGVYGRHRGYSGKSGSPFQDRADGLDLFNFSYTDVFDVFGREKNLGVAFNINRRISSTTGWEMGTAGVHYTGISQAYVNPNSDNPLTRLFGTGDFNSPAETHNVGLNVDYKLSPDAYVFANVSVNYNNNYQQYFRPAFGDAAATVANFTPDSTYDHSVMLPHAASTGISESSGVFTKKSLNYAFSAGGEQNFFQRTLKLSLRGSYSHADIKYPGWVRARALTSGIGFEIDRRGQDEWYPIFRQIGGPSIYDPASYTMSAMTRQTLHAPARVYSLRADLTRTLDTAAPASIKFGVKYNEDLRKQSSTLEQSTFVGADGIANSSDDALTPYATNRLMQGDGRYGPFPFMGMPGSGDRGDPITFPSGYWRQTAADAYTSYATTKSGDAEFGEKITAAYLLGRIRLGKLRVLSGVRIEETQTEGTGWVRNTTATWGGNSVGGASLDPAIVAANVARAQRSFVRLNTSGGKYRDVFPGLHFVYEPAEGLLIRASYNRALSRPPVANLIPTITESLEANMISIGNPELKPYHTNSYELSVEKYFEPVGLFSIGVFRKDISDYFRTISETVPAGGIDGGGLYAGYTVSTSRNVGSARVRGIEVSYQQQFSFLPGVLKGLGAFANFTYLQAEGDFGATTTTTKLGGLAPRSGNAGLNYRYRGLDVRLLANWTDQRFSGTNGGVDAYLGERRLLDLKLQYNISRRYSVFSDVTNLTDEATRTIISLNRLRFMKNNNGVTYTAGVSGKF